MPENLKSGNFHEDLIVPHQRRSLRNWQLATLSFFTCASILTFAAFATKYSTASLACSNHHPSHTPELTAFTLPIQHDNRGTYIQCPRDPTLRDAANCSFDLLLNGWFPSPCFDKDLHHDFVDGRNYSFYYDFEATQRVPQSEILQGDVDLYPNGLWVSFDEHFHHCEYLLNATFRALARSSSGIADVFLAPGHMQHCLRLMGQSRPADFIETSVRAFFRYNRCYLSLNKTFLPL